MTLFSAYCNGKKYAGDVRMFGPCIYFPLLVFFCCLFDIPDSRQGSSMFPTRELFSVKLYHWPAVSFVTVYKGLVSGIDRLGK